MGEGEIVRRAAVQYGDARGTISIDTFGGAEGMDLSQLAHECSVPGRVVGFNLYVSQDKGNIERGAAPFEVATFYSVPNAIGFDQLQALVREQEGEPLPVEAYTVKLPDNFRRYFKRLSIVIRDRAIWQR